MVQFSETADSEPVAQQMSPLSLPADEYTATRHKTPPSYEQNTKNAIEVAGMNSEMDRWTQASAPDLFEKGIRE